jgi:hypothetical protein
MTDIAITQESPANDSIRALNITDGIQVRTETVQNDLVKKDETNFKRGLESLFVDEDQQSG